MNELIIMQIDAVPTTNVTAILAWIVGVLIAVVIFIVVGYEKKLTKISDRLDNVLDDSLKRMAEKSETSERSQAKFADLITKLHEILIISRGK